MVGVIRRPPSADLQHPLRPFQAVCTHIRACRLELAVALPCAYLRLQDPQVSTVDYNFSLLCVAVLRAAHSHNTTVCCEPPGPGTHVSFSLTHTTHLNVSREQIHPLHDDAYTRSAG